MLLVVLPVMAVVQNPDGSVTLSAEEGVSLMKGIEQVENDRDYWIRIAKGLKKELDAEKSKKCI